MITKTFEVTLYSFFQVAVFIFLYEAIVEYYVVNYGPMNKLFGFEMQIDAGIYLLYILAGINSLAQILIKNSVSKIAVTISTALVWIYFWANIASVAPNRFALISVLGFLSLSIGILLFSSGTKSSECDLSRKTSVNPAL